MGGGERSFTLLTSALPVHPVAAWHLLNRGNEVCARVCAHTSPPPWPWPSLSHRARRRTEGVPPACASRCQRASLGRCPAHVSHLSRASLLNYFVLLFPRTFTTPVRCTPRRRVLEGEERGAREVDIKELLQGLQSSHQKRVCCAAGVYEEEKKVAHVFQPLPFYYLELAHTLSRVDPTDTFGTEGYAQVGGCCAASG